MAPQQKAVKRKAQDRATEVESDDDDAQGSDVEMLDVSFEFFDPQPQDYHAIKLLLMQLTAGDSVKLDLGSVADLIVEQKLVGTTVKTDGGSDADPYAVLTVLNLNVHKERAGISSLIEYILSKSSSDKPLHDRLTSLLSADASTSTAQDPRHVGLVVSERLVNMPAQIVPPMYKMLGEELEWAREDGEPYHFSDLLFLSRVFLASVSELDEDPNAALMAVDGDGDQAGDTSATKKKAGKKAKKVKSGQHVSSAQKDEEQTWMYHPEDEVVARHATAKHVFSYSNSTKQSASEAEAFGVATKGQLMLVPWTKYDEIVKGMEEYLGSAAGDS